MFGVKIYLFKLPCGERKAKFDPPTWKPLTAKAKKQSSTYLLGNQLPQKYKPNFLLHGTYKNLSQRNKTLSLWKNIV